MAAIVIVVVSVFSNKTAQMIFVQDDDMVEQFLATISCPSLRDAVLPRAAVRSSDRFHAKRSDGIPNLGSKYSITIMDQILVLARDITQKHATTSIHTPFTQRKGLCQKARQVFRNVLALFLVAFSALGSTLAGMLGPWPVGSSARF